MIIYLLVSVMVDSSVGKSNIYVDTIPFKELKTCREVIAKIKPDLEKKHDKVEMSCQEKEVK